MPLIIPPGFAQAVWSMTVTGDAEPMVTTCGLDVSAAAGEFQDCADKAQTMFQNGFGQMISNQVTMTHCTLYVGQDGGPPAIFDSTNGGSVGDIANTPLPNNCAWLVRKRTDMAGRRGRGRFYIPGVAENFVDPAGVINNAEVAAMTDVAELFRSTMESAVGGPSMPLVVLHRSEGIGVEPPPTLIAQLVCETKIATQRRRMRP